MICLMVDLSSNVTTSMGHLFVQIMEVVKNHHSMVTNQMVKSHLKANIILTVNFKIKLFEST